ncbi:MAG: DUF4339 domain-containing protein [Verrucomicrobiaceae bacterium]|nr:DUF4339 domain-containing protein [Verrucomicrobiaceae bacterium]
MDEWHYKRGEAEFGPMSATQIRALKERGTLKPETPVRRGGTSVWLPLAAADLHAAVPEAPPVPVPVAEAKPDSPAFAEVYAPPKASAREPLKVPRTLLATAILLSLILLHIGVLRLAEVVLIGLHQQDLETTMPFTRMLWSLTTLIYEIAGHSLDWMFIPLFLALMAWQGCAFAALRRLYGDAMLTHGPASGLWWLAPLANLVMPFFCLRELRHLSRRQRQRQQVGIPFGPVLWVFEINLVISVLLDWILNLNERAMDGFTDSLVFDSTTMTLSAITSLAGAVFSFTMLIIVMGNLRQQMRLHEHWQD